MSLKIKLIIVILLLSSTIYGQNSVSVDGIIAVIGQRIILKSDVEGQMIQYKARGITLQDNMKCNIFEELLYQNLLLNQAKIDSIEVSDSRVDSELQNRLAFYEEQMGGREEMETYFGKAYIEIKSYLRDVVKDQIIAQTMQSEITIGTQITPEEVKKFHKKIPKDSLPIIESEIEISQIIIYPEIKPEQIKYVKKNLEDYKKRIIEDGDDFSMLATLYSDDEGSAKNGGDLGWVRRGDLVHEFAEAAFGLEKKGEISEVIETEYGFHIIQFLEQKGERINLRHILKKPRVSAKAKMKAKNRLDSISKLIRNKEMTFEDAAIKFSEDEDSKINGGIVVNPYTGTSMFESSQIDPATNYTVKQMKIDEISDSYESMNMKGKSEMKIIKLNRKTKAHIASFETDYQKISDMALEEIRTDVVNEWIKEKQKTTFVRIVPEFRTCNFKHKGWIAK